MADFWLCDLCWPFHNSEILHPVWRVWNGIQRLVVVCYSPHVYDVKAQDVWGNGYFELTQRHFQWLYQGSSSVNNCFAQVFFCLLFSVCNFYFVCTVVCFVCLSVRPSVCMYVCPHVSLFACLPVCPHTCLSVCQVKGNIQYYTEPWLHGTPWNYSVPLTFSKCCYETICYETRIWA
jgi:hypothetical protein